MKNCVMMRHGLELPAIECFAELLKAYLEFRTSFSSNFSWDRSDVNPDDPGTSEEIFSNYIIVSVFLIMGVLFCIGGSYLINATCHFNIWFFLQLGN